jgi:hypothetical protein
MSALRLSRIGSARRPLAFLLAAGGVYAAALAVAAALPRIGDAGVVAAALTADLALVVPALYWLILVRGRGWPKFSVAPVFLASLAGAAAVLPDDHEGALGAFELLAVPAELALIAYLLTRAVGTARRLRAAGGGDLFERLRERAREVLVAPAVAEVVAFEIAILFYALFAWRAEPDTAGARAVFGHYRRMGYGAALAGLLLALGAEIVPVHLLVALWSPVAAWALTLLGLYSVLWLIGDYRALRLRPSVVRGEVLELRLGLRWTARVPLASIRSVRHTGAHPPARSTPGYLRAVVLGEPRHLLELSAPVEVLGPYGWRKRVRLIGITVDDEGALEGIAPPAAAPPA